MRNNAANRQRARDVTNILNAIPDPSPNLSMNDNSRIRLTRRTDDDPVLIEGRESMRRFISENPGVDPEFRNIFERVIDQPRSTQNNTTRDAQLPTVNDPVLRNVEPRNPLIYNPSNIPSNSGSSDLYNHLRQQEPFTVRRSLDAEFDRASNDSLRPFAIPTISPSLSLEDYLNGQTSNNLNSMNSRDTIDFTDYPIDPDLQRGFHQIRRETIEKVKNTNNNLQELSYNTLLSQLYGLPDANALPEFLILNDLKVNFIPFEEAAKMVSQNKVSRFILEPMLQPWAGPPGNLSLETPNRIITVLGTNGMTYLVKAKYDQASNQIFEPF